MAFTVADFEDLYRLLAEHPEWRDRLRPLILGDEFLQVPSRLDRIEQLMEQMVERQGAFEERQAGVEERLTSIEQAIRSLTIQIAELAELVRAHEFRLNRMDGRMGNIEGQLLEQRYALDLNSGFGAHIRKPTLINHLDLEQLQAAAERGEVSAEDLQRLKRLDFLVQGPARSDGESLLLAVEVSHKINIEDIDRAERAAEVLRTAGYRAQGFVGGYQIEDIVRTAADAVGVIVDLRRPPETLVA